MNLSGLEIVGRSRWGARGGRGDRTRHDSASTIYVHHSAGRGAAIDTFSEQCAAMRQIEAYHLSQGWDGIGYNYIIFQPYSRRRWHRARVFEGRGLGHIPAAQAGHNSRNIAICIVGNFEHEDVRAGTVRKLVSLLRRLPGGRVRGHRDVVQTSCPGDNLYHRLREIRRKAGKT